MEAEIQNMKPIAEPEAEPVLERTLPIIGQLAEKKPLRLANSGMKELMDEVDLDINDFVPQNPQGPV